jgi:hypothetical protein
MTIESSDITSQFEGVEPAETVADEQLIAEAPEQEVDKEAARKQRLLENLKKGRQTALANRRKKQLAKKLKAERENIDIETEIIGAVDDSYDSRIRSLEKKLDELEGRGIKVDRAELLNKVSKEEPPPPQPKVEPAKPAVVVKPKTPPVKLSTFDLAPW